MIEYLDEVIRSLLLILPKVSRYDKIFKVKDGDKDKNHNLKSLHIDDEKLLEKYKNLWRFKSIKLNALLVYDNRYIKTKIGTYSDKVYANFGGLNVPEDGVEYESFTIISIDSLLV